MRQKKAGHEVLVGVDEVGRGPLAGPVAVGIVTFPKSLKHLVFKTFGEVRDSKKLTEKGRELWLKKIKKLKEDEVLNYVVVHKSAQFIDESGISKAIRSCVEMGLKKLALKPKNSQVLLDGSLHAPDEYKNQKTIIKGDEKELIIALASIVAKVSRDKKMVHLAKIYPRYGLEVHKGYGTLEHRRAIKKLGLTAVHRKSFCTRILIKK